MEAYYSIFLSGRNSSCILPSPKKCFTSNIPTLSWWRYSGVGHSRDRLGTPGTLWVWALQGDSEVGHSREALQADSAVGHSRKALGLGTPGTSGVGHSRDTLELGTPSAQQG